MFPKLFLPRKLTNILVHTFNWSPGWGRRIYTTNLRYYPTFRQGPHNHVYLNGRELVKELIRNCTTGQNGWVEVYVEDSKGPIIRGENAVTKRLHGVVEYRDDRID